METEPKESIRFSIAVAFIATVIASLVTWMWRVDEETNTGLLRQPTRESMSAFYVRRFSPPVVKPDIIYGTTNYWVFSNVTFDAMDPYLSKKVKFESNHIDSTTNGPWHGIKTWSMSQYVTHPPFITNEIQGPRLPPLVFKRIHARSAEWEDVKDALEMAGNGDDVIVPGTRHFSPKPHWPSNFTSFIKNGVQISGVGTGVWGQ